MLRRPPHRRPGFSLTEVIVALFIVAAGLIALLTLFPLGAVQMAQAMRDDRSQQCAMQADAKLRYGWRRGVSEPLPLVFSESPDYRWISDAMPVAAGPPVTGTAPSYPILFDPIGSTSYSPPRRSWVAGQVNGILRPMPASHDFNGSVANASTWSLGVSLRYCTLRDDLEFAPDGTPSDRDGLALDPASPNALFGQKRYTWAALLQRPDSSKAEECGLKVLVFDRRAAGVDSLDAERSFAVGVSVGDTVIDLPAAFDTVPLKAGGWLFDGTVIDPVPAGGFAAPNAGTGIRNGHFYRVQSVTDVGGVATRVELQTPLVRPTGSPATTAYTARLYVFADLIDVYDRPNLAPSGFQKQTP